MVLRRRFLGSAVVLAMGACGGDDGVKPADARIDTPPSMCGAEAFFTGEVVDWDSTDAKFCGVFNAKLTARGQATLTDNTSPNGRFELCIPHQALTTFDVAYSATPSACATPSEVYPGAAVVVAPTAVLETSSSFSLRAMTQTRRDAMFAQVGQAYDPAKAQLVVYVDGAASAVSIAASHATTQRFENGAWTAGDTGAYVWFPNVAPGATAVTVALGARGDGPITLEAGVFTYLTVFTR